MKSSCLYLHDGFAFACLGFLDTALHTSNMPISGG